MSVEAIIKNKMSAVVVEVRWFTPVKVLVSEKVSVKKIVGYLKNKKVKWAQY